MNAPIEGGVPVLPRQDLVGIFDSRPPLVQWTDPKAYLRPDLYAFLTDDEPRGFDWVRCITWGTLLLTGVYALSLVIR